MEGHQILRTPKRKLRGVKRDPGQGGPQPQPRRREGLAENPPQLTLEIFLSFHGWPQGMPHGMLGGAFQIQVNQVCLRPSACRMVNPVRIV